MSQAASLNKNDQYEYRLANNQKKGNQDSNEY
ncbi:hypothetical protein MPL3356_340065 [Mesorhizobium plurifarium]|uniref:Uncharacterized protein n=1 Tax=Mesorhizobium plurifarium TaxID=69974 RepID=A0A090E269_MESPL|nr:hypothetical protein MPL3356_340065 [Mesorhizobium plurifarium]